MKKFFTLLATLFCFANQPQAADFTFVELSATELAKIDELSSSLVESVKQKNNAEFGYDDNSVRFLSDTINKESKHYSEQAEHALANIFGAYLGTAIIKKYGGQWVKHEEMGYCIQLDGKNIVRPFNRVVKQFENGEEDSIYSLYISIREITRQIGTSD